MLFDAPVRFHSSRRPKFETVPAAPLVRPHRWRRGQVHATLESAYRRPAGAPVRERNPAWPEALGETYQFLDANAVPFAATLGLGALLLAILTVVFG